jgi:hypothetical protein
MLEDFAEDSAVVKRVTLLYSFNVGKEFRKLPFQSTMMDVFRTSSPQTTASATASCYHEPPKLKGPMAWARLGNGQRAVVHGSQTEKILLPGRKVLVNALGQRVDEPLSQPSMAAMNGWNHKIKKANMRYCRSFHLNGACQGNCGYSHGPLSDAEKLVFRLQLRRDACKEQLRCRDKDCYFGHNCSCKDSGCKLPKEIHGVDISTTEVWMSG